VELPVSAESVVPVASRNTNSGEMPLDRVTFAFKVKGPLDAEHEAPGEPPPPVPTVIVKAGSGTVVVPSLTLMMMSPEVPAADGVPVRAPVEVLNDAQAGICWMLKVNGAPAPPAAVGVNE
jgi:hypothetical protein